MISRNNRTISSSRNGLPFFLNERVILFAVTTEGESARYAIKEFYTKKEQAVELRIRQTNRKELLEKIKEIRLEGVRLEKVETETIIVPLPCDQIRPSLPTVDSSDTIRAANY